MIELKCFIDHGTYKCDDTFVDFLIPPSYTDSVFKIPICQSCKNTLDSKDKTWVLIFCVNCFNNAWRLRAVEGIPWEEDMVIYFNSCNQCENRFL